MKILQINCVYGTGSTGRLTQAIHTRLLAEGIKSVVCYGRGPRSTCLLYTSPSPRDTR